MNDNFTIGNYIGFKPDGSYDPSFVNAHGNTDNTNDGSAQNIWDISNHNTVQYNWMAAAQSAVQVAENCNNNIITDNHMGIAPNGDDGAMGFDGVRIRGTSSGNQVLRNVIANAGQAGVSVVSFNDRNNLISQNTITNVGTLGIDLAPLAAVNPNDVNDVDNGPNTLQNFPVITSASTTTVSGTAPSNTTVELFRTRFGLPGENGPADTYVGTVKAGAIGNFSFTGLTLSAGDVLTTTDTTSVGNTSELGANVAVPGAPPNVQGVTYDDFQGYCGTGVNDIPAGTAPTHTGRVANFQSPIDRGDNLGTRLRAYVTAPTTGDYTFWVSSDDASQLFLSLDGNPDHRLPIASIAGWVPQGHYDDVATQKSGTFTLQAGQKYYLEAYAKEGGGEDHLEVAWSGPGIARQVIKAQYLSPTSDGCSGWCPNYVPAGHGVQFDDYQGFGGTSLTDIPQGTSANSSTVLPGSFQSPIDRSDNAGTRLRAMLTVPVTGTYTFWVASDDNSGLFLSPSSDPNQEVEIASVPQWTPYMAFDNFATQQSGQITLTAGQQYFMEAYAKEGGGGDHLEVAWSGPGFGRTLVPAAFITPTTAGCSGWCPYNVPAGHGVQFDDFQGFPGINLSDIPAGTASNSSTALQTGFISPINRGDNLGTRLRAILTAPATGSYTFWVASDDAGAVYLSPSTDPAQAVKIARVDGHTGMNAYDDNPTQMSTPVTLQGGQQYYIEAYTKEGTGEDFVQVAWSGPGFARMLVPGNVLTPTTTGCLGWCPVS